MPQSGPHAVQQTLNAAVQSHQSGDLAAAKRLYEHVLKAQPNHPGALHLLGVVASQMGKPQIAIELISKAIAQKSDVADMYYNLANVLRTVGQREEAVKQYRKAIRFKANYVDAYFNLGLSHHELGQLSAAEDALRQALGFVPKNATLLLAMGNIVKDQGRLDDALSSYNAALTQKPDMFEAHANLGLVMQKLNRPADAIACFQKALSIAPRQAQLHFNLGNVLQEDGQLDAAAASYRQALSLQPNIAGAYYGLGQALRGLGDPQAFHNFRQAVRLEPNVNAYWEAYGACVGALNFEQCDDELLDDLDTLLGHPTVRPHVLAQPILSALKSHPGFALILREGLNAQSTSDLVFEDVAKRLATYRVFITLLKLSHLADLEIERLLQRLRHVLLNTALQGGCASSGLGLGVAMALQAFTNEYVLSETREETECLRQLEDILAADADAQKPIDPVQLVTLAVYRPLYAYAWAQALADQTWPDGVDEVIQRQVREPQKERALAAGISRLSNIDEDVSQAVRAQYEEHPYPRWVRTGLCAQPMSLAVSLRHIPCFQTPENFTPKSPAQVLIAGCGTGQQALNTASSLSDAQVLAIDLSLSSLTYAQRKTQDLGIKNIEYAQADILELEALGRSFDLIESVGVLHHMADPVAGWGVLCGLLAPGGYMKIGLYSEVARQSVVKARQLAAQKNYAPNLQDMRRLRQELIEMSEQGDRELSGLLEFTDFYALSEFRDLVFHVQEHRFSLNQIDIILKDLNLMFLGFELRNPNTRVQFEQDHPQPGALAQLKTWHAFEAQNPDTFRGMYQFWCQKKP